MVEFFVFELVGRDWWLVGSVSAADLGRAWAAAPRLRPGISYSRLRVVDAAMVDGNW